jgi:hypothetical protein
MDSGAVPAALARRLGEDGTEGLLSVLDATRDEWSETVMTLAADRFERRLTQEVSALRVDLARELGAFRADVGREIAALRVEFGREITALRVEFGREIGELRAEIAGFRVEMAGIRVEQLKWSFVFWVGQVAVTGGLVALMVRMLR